jgi:hypothetical protein
MAADSTATEYHNSRQIIIFMFWKNLANFRSVAWLNLFWENIDGKLFAVCDDSYLHTRM